MLISRRLKRNRAEPYQLRVKTSRTGEQNMGRKQEKAMQRKAYKEAFKKVKHGHGGRAIRKKEETALGK
jgi:ribosomal protein L39E